MPSSLQSPTVAVIGGGIVGTAILYTLAHRGIDAVLLESEPGLAYCASGTNSGVLHTGFDSTPGELETELILRAAHLRPAVLEALGVPVLDCGAELVPTNDEQRGTVARLAQNALQNGVEVHIRETDGALLVPGESVTDPVALTLALASAAVRSGARIELNARVAALTPTADQVRIGIADGRSFHANVVINAAGLYADEVAALTGDRSFSIYPRKGEFFVFELPDGATLDRIILPVPTERTKGVLVFPSLDGKVIAGPTAIDLEDKQDWSVREAAYDEVLEKAAQQFPPLHGLAPIASYAGLRPAGRGVNYVVKPSATCPRLINVAAIRSTGLTASLGIADYAVSLLSPLGIDSHDQRPPRPDPSPVTSGPWWRRTADFRRGTAHT